VEEHNLKFDSFINCAGFEETIPLKQYNNSKIFEIFTVNIFSTIEILRLFSLKKYSNDGSSVVLVSSVMGNLGQPGKIGYCSSKAAINGLVKSSALELSKRKIRVNSVSPGIVNTELTQRLFLEVGQESRNRIIEKHPLGIGEVEDVVPAVLFLAIGKSQWISGIDLIVDGAYSAE
ncbi:MAG: SDR family oxidoreductase, partial [Cytophagaceae bacterium]|nr:SDR family oxidoreductase [Cytophagaceae bacterium]